MITKVPEEAKQEIMNDTPLGRLGTSEEVAEVVGFLASDAARWLIGHVFTASGDASDTGAPTSVTILRTAP